MKKLFRILWVVNFTIIAAHTGFSQVPAIEWQQTLGGSSYDQGESVIPTFDGGFITAGISTSNDGDVTGNHGFGDFWIAKIDASGSLQWQKSYGGSNDDGAFVIKQTADSGYIAAGTSTSSNGDVTFNHGFIDYWVMKTDASGNLLWQKSYGGSFDDVAYDISQTKDLGFIIAGYTTSHNGDVGSNHGSEDYWIVKTDSIGNIEWENTFGGGLDERAYHVQQTTDGGYVAGGYTKSTNGDVTDNHGDYDYWVVKMDSTGALQWQKALGGSKSDQGKTVMQTADGGYIIAGFTASDNDDVTFNHGSEDLWVAKLDSSATLQWEQSFGGSGVDQAYDLKQLDNGDYIIAGSSYSLDGDVTGNQGGTDDWVLRIDSMGNIIWETSLGGSSFEEAYSVAATDDDGFIVGGGTLSNDGDVSGNHGDFDYWILKITDQVALPVTEITTKPQPSMTVFPNPVSDNTIVEVSLNNQENISLEVLSVTGQKVKQVFKGTQEKGITQYNIDMKTSSYPPGFYMLRLIMDDKIVNAKVVKE